MGQKLVIVESPAKAKTIEKYLGKNFVVVASMGHVRDLPKSQMGVDIENNYEPKYITIRGKGELLDKLRKSAKKSEKVYLATDPDREGEAISWHLANILKIDYNEKCRIVFNEITKNAVKNALKCPRTINKNVFDAQQARRVLDRLVGYEISPILWKKIKWGLSAGRVQSVALRIICDRQKEIDEFEPKEYWTIEGKIASSDGKKRVLEVKLISIDGKKAEIECKKDADAILKDLKNKHYEIKSIKVTEKNKNPMPPFTTSTMQQDAYRKINFPTKKTMSTAQQLYEGIDVKGFGTVGLITYMRTDSVRISDEAYEAAKNYIGKAYGENYLPASRRIYKGKKNAQDAHEAIRPTNFEITPEVAKESLTSDQYKLYVLIWNRFIASQMASSIIDSTSIDIMCDKYKFKSSGYKVKFDGFTKVYLSETEEEENSKIPKVNEGEKFKNESIEGVQHFTQPPAKFSEASLVKTLEEYGIGRPSTYAPIISTLLGRKYVERNKKVLEPTELGSIVNNLMCEYFKQIVDVEFTAKMESDLDKVEEGSEEWRRIVAEFFEPLKKDIETAEKEIAKITIEDKVTDIKCDKCGRFMVIKHGRFGDFLACPGYPECENTKAISREIDAKCPKCGGKILEKRSRKGRTFYGCENYPQCDFVSWTEPTNERCPECNDIMCKKYSKSKGEYLECINKDCKYKKSISGK